MARRITCAFMMLRWASPKATAPASLSRPISVISRPASPLVKAAEGWMRTAESTRARRSTKSTIAGSSMTGSVSGRHTMVVMPPAAAARLAEASVSRCSAPGSPRKACRSTSPGARTSERQSMRRAFRRRKRRQMRADIGDLALDDEEPALRLAQGRGVDEPRIDEQRRSRAAGHSRSCLNHWGDAVPRLRAPPS